MAVYRASENPIIRPQDVKPSPKDFEVIGVFNAGVARFGEEGILLLRSAAVGHFGYALTGTRYQETTRVAQPQNQQATPWALYFRRRL